MHVAHDRKCNSYGMCVCVYFFLAIKEKTEQATELNGEERKKKHIVEWREIAEKQKTRRDERVNFWAIVSSVRIIMNPWQSTEKKERAKARKISRDMCVNRSFMAWYGVSFDSMRQNKRHVNIYLAQQQHHSTTIALLATTTPATAVTIKEEEEKKNNDKRKTFILSNISIKT